MSDDPNVRAPVSSAAGGRDGEPPRRGGAVATDGVLRASEDTLAVLEFPQLLAMISEFAATDLGRARVRALVPMGEPAALSRRRSAYEEARRLLQGRALVSELACGTDGLLQHVRAVHSPLAGEDFLAIAELLNTSSDALRRVLRADPPCEELSTLTKDLPPVDGLIAKIEATFDRRGELRDDASPQLAQLRHRVLTLRSRLSREFSEFVRGHRDLLSDDTVPMRAGRLVLVLQAGSRGRVPGLVHGKSGTGKSFYFEPLELVDSNNEMQQAVEDEAEEARRILAELGDEVRGRIGALEAHAGLVAELDCLQAAARFADLSNGRLPAAGMRHDLFLAGARHPLLDPTLSDLRRSALGQAGNAQPVVPLTLTLDDSCRTLVVTGPNAGGKTVALKTVGLLVLAAQSGLPIPIGAGSRLPFFDAVVATVGDEQNLLADRSTFSGRLLRLKEAWDLAGPDSLILLDELGSGTDPEEGAALATSLLEELLEAGATAVMTTHLTPLAAAALDCDGAGCAAMEFEPSTGTPTFRLMPGPPGGSEALALARRLGLDARWVRRAEERLGSEHRELRRLIAETERARRELASMIVEAEAERATVARLRGELESSREALRAERRAVARRLREELDEFRVTTRRKLAIEIERVREEVVGGRRRGLATAAVERLFAEAPDLPIEDAKPARIPTLGDRVTHGVLGWTGTLEKVDKGRVEVRVRGSRVRCRIEELTVAGGAPPVAGPRRGSVPGGTGRPRLAERAPGERVDAAVELKLIGQRVRPALEALDKYLDDALLASRDTVRVVHGHGSGALRDAIRGHLEGHPAVAAVRAGEAYEGGDGATVVTLR